MEAEINLKKIFFLKKYKTLLTFSRNDKSYQEALEASSQFNKRLCSERKMRIPFIDSQTRVAQTNCMMWWLAEYQRISDAKQKKSQSHLYEYPSRKWYKHRRHLFETATSSSSNAAGANPSLSNSNEPNCSLNQLNGGPDALANGSGPASAINGNGIHSHLLINENSNSMDSNANNNGTSGQQTLAKQVSNPNDHHHSNLGKFGKELFIYHSFVSIID